MKAWAIILGIISPASLFAVDFDCIPIQTLQSRPLECDDPGFPGYDPLWCSCLSTGLTTTGGGKAASIEQAIVYIYKEPTIGTFSLNVSRGTLDLSKVEVGDLIGKMVVDMDIGEAEHFFLDFEMVVTAVGPDSADFDMPVLRTNATSIAVLDYNNGTGSPLDLAHANGLTYQGNAHSFGVDQGFELNFHYLDYFSDPTLLPPGATSTGIEIGDLQSPNFTVPVMHTFPIGSARFLLPQDTPLLVDTVMGQILPPDPSNPVERTFSSSFDITVSTEKFRRGDPNGDKTVDLADVVFGLNYLFQDGPAPTCLDAADANDDGSVDLADSLRILFSLFGESEQPPAPGPSTCGPDLDADDTLPSCVYSC